MFRLIVAALIMCLTGSPALAQSKPANAPPPANAAGFQPYVYRVPAKLDDGWTTAPLASVGLDSSRIEAMTNALRRFPEWNIHAVLIERSGRLVYEEYFAGEDQRWGDSLGRVVFDRQTKHDLRSVSKSVVSALVGIALGSGKISSLDQALIDFFPEHKSLATAERRRITLRHALTFSAGIEWNEDVPYTNPLNDEIRMTDSKDPIGFVLSRAQVAAPGSTWNYNGGLTQVLGAIVERSTGQPLRDYARTVLFQPLGITDVEWVGDLAGTPAAASGLRLRPRDLAKFGSLYLHGGRWRDRQVIPAEWVIESTRRRIPTNTPVSAFGTQGYAFQWWHNCYQTAWGTFEARTAVGNGQQRIYVLPELRLVVTVMAGRYNDPNASRLPERLLLEHIIPALRLPTNLAQASHGSACGSIVPDK